MPIFLGINSLNPFDWYADVLWNPAKTGFEIDEVIANHKRARSICADIQHNLTILYKLFGHAHRGIHQN